MSPRSSESPGIYDGLLMISVGAMLAGIIFLCLELSEYGWELGS